MKNFSLKALGAFIFAAGLVVAGVAAPASATATAAWTTSQPTFAAGSTPAMDITFTPTDTSSSARYRQVAVTVKDAQGQSMALGNITTGSLSGCLLSSIGGTHVQIQSNTCTRVNTSPASYNLISVENAGGGGSLSAYGAFSISLLSGVANGLMAGQTYTVWVATMNDSTVVESATLSVTIPAPTTVTLNRNGGTGNVSQPSVSGGNVTLPANPFTRTGFNFTGWRKDSANAGTVYQPGDVVAVSGTVNFYAQWSPVSSGGSASASLALNATTGQLIAGSTVGVSASGLQSTAAYTVTVQSTPQTIGSGNAISGAVSTNVTLPSGLEAGWHTLTFTSTAADGSAVESKYYFKISASGTLLSTSSTIPAELANTGINTASGISLLAGGLSLALVGAEMFMIARRKRSN